MKQRTVILSLVLLLAAGAGFSQTATSRFGGTVVDPSGAAISGAVVALTNNRTGLHMESPSNQEGYFQFVGLPPGSYKVTVEHTGFKQKVIREVTLTVAEAVIEKISLEVGDVKTSVEVQSDTVERVQTADAQVSRVIVQSEINALPLGHEVLQVLRFQPGVAENGGADKVNGARSGSNNLRMDGVDSNNPIRLQFGRTIVGLNVDAIQEVRVILNGAKAEYGRNAGGQVEIATRGGANRFTGNALYYFRNTSLNANTFTNNLSGTPRPVLDQNYFGGSLGGPIRRDKTFFFLNYRAKLVSVDSTLNRVVLTPEAIAGQFRWRAPNETAIRSFNILTSDPRGIGLDKTVAKSLALLPAPNNNDVGDGLNTAGFRFNSPAASTEYQYTAKVDHNLTSKIRLFFRYSWLSDDVEDAAGRTYPDQITGATSTPRFGWAGGVDWNATPRLINELRFGRQEVGSYTTKPARVAGPMFTVGALYFDPLSVAFGTGSSAPVTSITDNLSFVRQKHVFKVGGSFANTLERSNNQAGSYPTLNLTRNNNNIPPATFGPNGATVIATAARQNFESLYNALLGRVGQIDQTFYSNLEQYYDAGTPLIRNVRYRDYGFFFQDDWRITRNVTLNLGIRYEFLGSPTELDRQQGVFDRADQVNGVSQIPDLKIVRTDRWFAPDRNNFAPRFGFAWAPGGSGRTSVRGSYGIFFDRQVDTISNDVDSKTIGFVQSTALTPNLATGSDIRLSDNPALPARPAAPLLQPAATHPLTNISIYNPNLRTAYVHSFNFTLQRELIRNVVLEAGYVGTRGVKLFQNRDVNQLRIYENGFLQAFKEIEAFRATGAAVPASNPMVAVLGSPAAVITALNATNFQSGLVGTVAENFDRTYYARFPGAGLSPYYLRNYPQYAQVLVGSNDGRSYYNALQLSVRTSFANLKLAANYTYSNTVDTFSADTGFSQVDSYNLRLNRGRSDSTYPHVFTSTAIYSLPFGRKQPFFSSVPRWADFIIGGWDLSSAMQFRTGNFFTISSGRRTTANAGYADYAGDRKIGALDKRGDGVYYYTAEEIARFSFPSAGVIGNSGRNAFQAPGLAQIDLALAKRFKITERHVVSYRLEAQNALNHANFTIPTTALATPASFGRIGLARNGRFVVMFLRYDF